MSVAEYILDWIPEWIYDPFQSMDRLSQRIWVVLDVSMNFELNFVLIWWFAMRMDWDWIGNCGVPTDWPGFPGDSSCMGRFRILILSAMTDSSLV